mgnify:FL=1
MTRIPIVLLAILILGYAWVGSSDSAAAIEVLPGGSINAAITAATPGSIIEIHAGTYSEQVAITKPVVLQPFGDGPVWVSGDCARPYGIIITEGGAGSAIKGLGVKMANESGVRIDDASDIVLDGLTIQDYNCANANLHLAAGVAVREATRITVTGSNIIRRVEVAGPLKGQGDALWFKNTRVDRGGGHAITNNRIIGGWDGLGGEGENSTVGILHKDSLVAGNHISDCDDDGIQVEGGTANVVVRDNLIERCAIGIAFAPSNVGPLTIERNRILNLVPGFYGSTNGMKIGDGGSGDVFITANILLTNNPDFPNAAASCIAQTNTGMGMRFVVTDNTFQCGAYIYEIDGTQPAGFVYDHNCMWTTDTIGRFVKWAGGVKYGSLAEFQQATGQEPNGRQTQDCSFLQPAPTVTPVPTVTPIPPVTPTATATATATPELLCQVVVFVDGQPKIIRKETSFCVEVP